MQQKLLKAPCVRNMAYLQIQMLPSLAVVLSVAPSVAPRRSVDSGGLGPPSSIVRRPRSLGRWRRRSPATALVYNMAVLASFVLQLRVVKNGQYCIKMQYLCRSV